MKWTEITGVDKNVDFKVKGLSETYRIVEQPTRFQRIALVLQNDELTGVTSWVYDEIIAAAPSGIIRLPPPLTDEQRDQLKALYTLTFRWIVKNKKGAVIAYSHKPYRYDEYWWATEKVDANIQSVAKELSVCSLVSWSDPEPYDIGKALGVEG